MQCCWPGAQYVTSTELMAVLLPHPTECWDHRYMTSPGHYWSSLLSLFFALLTLEHAPHTRTMQPGCLRLSSDAIRYQLYGLGQVLQLLWAKFSLYTADKDDNHHRKVERSMWGMCKSLKSVCYRVNAISMSLVPWLSDLLGAVNFCCLWVFLRSYLSTVPPPAWLTQYLLWWQVAGPETSSFNFLKVLQSGRSTILTDNGLLLKSDSCGLQAFLPRTSCGFQDGGWGKNMGLSKEVSGLEFKWSISQCLYRMIWDLAHLVSYNFSGCWDTIC